MKTTPTRMLEEFASTFEEWHYLAGGLAIGFVAGWVGHALFLLAREG